ncbi:ClpXP adapter SpxH family protein [Chitinophaga sp. Cy-1792]|uniref:ClpXP adapter SpxH family protein n=1 Tax=Chitinophaga sp. Cy-1792 TaxID=2608339 RepID=UPI001421B3F7|nr:ClpXP adapter SpxH family protein [Chitinophaga sp. Cy-1792]NIG55832.1 DsbA family protein [Chitinophaga sp. Cy-1792]
MSDNTIKPNPLLCDPVTGTCELPAFDNKELAGTAAIPGTKPLKVVYFTDPICSSCWGIEPQLRKLKLEYGNIISIDYRMGGLLPDWSYNSGGISKPSDVAHHWDEVSAYYDMPIVGDVWLEDPLASSYPPSIAFKAAQLQDNEKAILFLRVIREMVFLEKKNITRWEHIAAAAQYAQLEIGQFKSDYEGSAKLSFEEDLKLAREYGVRGFPSLFFEANGEKEFVYGVRPYAQYEAAVLKLHPNAAKSAYDKNTAALFSKYPSLTSKEFSELAGIHKSETFEILHDLVLRGILEELTTRNGSLWKWK